MNQPEPMQRYRIIALRFASSCLDPGRRNTQTAGVIQPSTRAPIRKALWPVKSGDHKAGQCFSMGRDRMRGR